MKKENAETEVWFPYHAACIRKCASHTTQNEILFFHFCLEINPKQIKWEFDTRVGNHVSCLIFVCVSIWHFKKEKDLWYYFFLGGGESSASDLTCVFICLSCAYLVPYLIDFHATATTTEFHTTCSSTLQSKSFLPPTTTTISFLFCCGLPMKNKIVVLFILHL